VAPVFIDTNVLFPFSVMDLMLALTEDHVHEIVWTEALLAEWERVIVREHRRSPDSAASVTAAIRAFFADAELPATAYEHLVAEMPGDDPDDHRHMAAAIAAHAAALVTWNQVDFPAAPLAEHGVEVLDPDHYLHRLMTQFPREVADTVVRLAAEKRRPPKTTHELVADLQRAGLDQFSAALTDELGLRPH
jgi:predicted nucleic acid-binding protein